MSKRPSMFQILSEELMFQGIPEGKAKKMAKEMAPQARKFVESTPAPSEQPAVKPQNHPVEGSPEIQLLDTLDGLTSTASYVTAAKKGTGFMAVRSHNGGVKVKFYPNLEHWNLTPDDLKAMGISSSVVQRDYYQRVWMNNRQFAGVLSTVKVFRIVEAASTETVLNNLPDSA